MYSRMNPWASLYILGRPNTLLAQAIHALHPVAKQTRLVRPQAATAPLIRPLIHHTAPHRAGRVRDCGPARACLRDPRCGVRAAGPEGGTEEAEGGTWNAHTIWANPWYK